VIYCFSEEFPTALGWYIMGENKWYIVGEIWWYILAEIRWYIYVC
jgi:hypothetical protein